MAYRVLFNMPIRGRAVDTLPASRLDDKGVAQAAQWDRWDFQITPKMSPHTLAIVAAPDLYHITQFERGVNISIWTTKDLKPET